MINTEKVSFWKKKPTIALALGVLTGVFVYSLPWLIPHDWLQPHIANVDPWFRGDMTPDWLEDQTIGSSFWYQDVNADWGRHLRFLDLAFPEIVVGIVLLRRFRRYRRFALGLLIGAILAAAAMSYLYNYLAYPYTQDKAL